MSPIQALRSLRPGDVLLNRLDVTETLDAIEPGMEVVRRLGLRGTDVLNTPASLRATHDKLMTARLLGHAGVPTPSVKRLTNPEQSEIAYPLVLKPRFGSWGREVVRCSSTDELRAAVAAASGQSWFTRGCALVQEYVPHSADTRLVIVGGVLIGAIERRPTRTPIVPSQAPHSAHATRKPVRALRPGWHANSDDRRRVIHVSGSTADYAHVS